MLFISTPIKAENINHDINELLYDSISYDGVIDLEKIEKYLKAGANPNWVNKKYKTGQSVWINFYGWV